MKLSLKVETGCEVLPRSLPDKNGIAEFLYPLFWEYDPGTVDVVKHADLVMGRIMERGGWAAMCWLRKTYTTEQLVSFLERRGKRVLPIRELNYWAVITEIPEEKKQMWFKEARKAPYVWRRRVS